MATSKRRGMPAFLTVLVVLGLVGWGGVELVRQVVKNDRREMVKRLPRALVQRSDLHSKFRTGGEVQSADRTLIECELENLSLYSEGRTFSANGSSQIIELVPEGTMVKAGDVLCRLDSSVFEEMVRQQEIKLLQAQAERERAKYTLQAQEIELLEYREGLLVQQRQALQSQLTLSKSEMQRQTDRLAWAKQMVAKGYLSQGQLLSDESRLLREQINKQRLDGEQAALERFKAPTMLMRLESQVLMSQFELKFQDIRVRRREEQLAQFRRQVENCTIRAPHDGMVVYAASDEGATKIALGSTVYQKMDLFYLPDFTNMEVWAVLNETKVSHVSEGMPALVRVEALPQYVLEGQVESVSPLPLPPRNWRMANDVHNFLARVKLHNAPKGLRPGMSAEVEIETSHRPGALLVPTTAVAIEDGREVCYVPMDDVVERRYVVAEPASLNYLEVTFGLRDGEEVVLDPARMEEGLTIVDGPLPTEPVTVAAELSAVP